MRQLPIWCAVPHAVSERGNPRLRICSSQAVRAGALGSLGSVSVSGEEGEGDGGEARMKGGMKVLARWISSAPST